MVPRPTIYIIGSLRNANIPSIGNDLRKLGYEAFDDWFSPGPETDDYWQRYETFKGKTYKEALQGYAAKHVFDFDFYHLSRSHIALLVTPAGKSGHLELGYMLGKGKPGYVLFDDEPERWDVMYQFATDVFFNKGELFDTLTKNHPITQIS